MRYAMKLKAICLLIAVVFYAASSTVPMSAQKRSEPISVGMVALLNHAPLAAELEASDSHETYR